MLASILGAGGVRAIATGNVGYPILDAVLADPAYDVLAVELSSFQLHWTSTVEFTAARDPQRRARPPRLARLDAGVRAGQGGDLAGERGRGLQRGRRGLVASLAAGRERTVGFTLARPGAGVFGISDGALVDGDGTVLARGRGRPAGRPAQRRQRAGRRGTRRVGRCRAVGGPRRAARVLARGAPDHPGRVAVGGRLRRRLQGDQPARGGGVAAGLRPRRLGGGRAGEGRAVRGRRRGRRRTGSAASC